MEVRKRRQTSLVFFLDAARSTREIPPAAAEVSASSRSDEDTSIEGSDILETEPWDLMGAFAKAEPGSSLGNLVQVHVSARSSLFKGNNQIMHGGAHCLPHTQGKKIIRKEKV
jgi:ornithine carbamoyltransferase